MSMNEPIEVFVDNCVFYHSLINPDRLSETHKWLKREILPIKKIIDLRNNGIVKIEYDLNVMIEMHRGGKDNKIKKIRGKIKPSPTFVNFQAVMTNYDEIRDEDLERRLDFLKNVFKDDSLDITHLVQAEAYGVKYFVTTDKKLISKSNNQGKDILKVKVLSPSCFLKEPSVKRKVRDKNHSTKTKPKNK